jgi:DNA-binding NarL/FixJ family response regulator
MIITDNTVKTHINRLYSKLGLRDRAQVVIVAYELGLVTPSNGFDRPGARPANGT